MSFSGNNPRFNSTSLTDIGAAGSAVSPEASSHKVIDRNGVLYVRDSSGVERLVSTGLNVVTSPHMATSWAATGSGVTVATSSTSSDLPLEGVVPTSIKVLPVSGTTDYVYYRFTIPASLKSSSMSVSWYQRSLGGYTGGDLKFDVYTNSASNYGGSYTRVALSSDSASVTAVAAGSISFTANFTSTSADYYEIRFTRTAGTSACNFCNVIVGAAATAVSQATADGISLGSVTSFAPVVKSSIKSVSGASYVVLDNDGYQTVYVDCSGADRAVTLPATANNVGRRIRFIKTDTNQTKVVNITAAGADVIYSGGSTTATTVTLQKFNECRELECMSSGFWVQKEAASTSIVLTTLDGGFTGGSLNLVRVGNIVHVQVQSPTWSSGSFTYTSTLTVAGNYRPPVDTVWCGAPSNGSHAYSMTWMMLATGAVRMESSTNTNAGPDNYPGFTGSYILR